MTISCRVDLGANSGVAQTITAAPTVLVLGTAVRAVRLRRLLLQSNVTTTFNADGSLTPNVQTTVLVSYGTFVNGAGSGGLVPLAYPVNEALTTYTPTTVFRSISTSMPPPQFSPIESWIWNVLDPFDTAARGGSPLPVDLNAGARAATVFAFILPSPTISFGLVGSLDFDELN